MLNCMSGCLDLPDKEYEMIEFAGSWNRERHPHSRELTYGIRVYIVCVDVAVISLIPFLF